MNEPWKRVVEVAMVFIGAVYGPDLELPELATNSGEWIWILDGERRTLGFM